MSTLSQSVHRTQVIADWVDYNGHMNDAEYARVFSQAVDALMDQIGLDAAGREALNYTIYTLETHLCYRQEVHLDEVLDVQLVLLDKDAKRLHAYFTLVNAQGETVATSEQMLMGMDTLAGKPAAFPEAIATQVDALPCLASGEEKPSGAGRQIGIKRR